MTEETKLTTKPKRKVPVQPAPKPAKVNISPEYATRLRDLARTSGLTMQALTQALIEGPLKQIEAGGSIVINASTGEVTVGRPAPVHPSQLAPIHPNQPPPPNAPNIPAHPANRPSPMVSSTEGLRGPKSRPVSIHDE